ncbi:uncharacterized protein PV06_06488 [Exophiala oligosperma]|uniref:Uncharacterized protein n=1 Tax=Exophiala oligosperma TaxID=215243 RepID=A0A0D2E5E7_9EURO|nr:uncharacterized protein PV06_06488 [Exophiala oligosperma]KIW42999.1 hypothetical protein PV06_06488 [Exophiala oligosperma]
MALEYVKTGLSPVLASQSRTGRIMGGVRRKWLSYTPIAQVLQRTFRRECAIVGFQDPEVNITDQDLEDIMTTIKR